MIDLQELADELTNINRSLYAEWKNNSPISYDDIARLNEQIFRINNHIAMEKLAQENDKRLFGERNQ